MDLFALSVPLYLLLILIEAGYGAWKKQKIYRLNDTIANLNTGVLSIIYGLGPKATMFFLYIFVYEKIRIFSLPDTWWAFIICLIAVDFCAYWFHRLSHEINFVWGSHMVHHRSEEFNLSVALRQSANGIFPAIVFFLPAALLGVSPEMYTIMGTINLVYQFTIHTQLIGKLPAPIEYVFNTPSHHRVHHAVNPQYIDKNYSGIFIIFDRIFGTFQPEEEKVTYGITKPLTSWSPLWSNIEHFIAIWKNTQLTTNWIEKLRMIFDKPGWMPERLGGQQVVTKIPVREKYNTKFSRLAGAYILLQFSIYFSLFSVFYYNLSRFDNTDIYLTFGGFMLVAIIASTGMMEKKEWAWPIEMLKNIAIPIVVGYLFVSHSYYLILTTTYSIVAIISLGWLYFLKEEYNFNLSRTWGRLIGF